jgi:hypothetical protein
MIYVVCANEIVTSDSEVSYKNKKMLKAFSTKEKATQYLETLPYLATLDKIAEHIDFIRDEDDNILQSDTFLTAFFYEFLTRKICTYEVRELLADIIKEGTSCRVDWDKIKETILLAVKDHEVSGMQETLEKLLIAPYTIEEVEIL